ncbi:MAG TPA: tetratricopeptide repeat protein, partial [Thermoanaerobaculia bacterium]|nr:tetratricopeptide repeat protein [Thermoanaerobaculia bacterium]
SDGPDSYFEALSAALNRGWAPLRGLLRQTPNGARKYIALPLPEAYDLPRDPGETKNLVDADRRGARAAFDALPAASAWPPPARAALGGEEEARMLALGYAASVAPTKAMFGPEDDPKRLVGLDTKIHHLVEAYASGDVERAISLARELVAARPMPLGHSLLANALLEAGRTDEALAVMEKARAAGLAADTLLRQLGLTLAGAGRTAEAVAVLQPLADRGDLDAMNNLALAHSEAGLQREAFTTLQQVLARDPDNAKALELLGLVELRLHHWPQARDASRRAVQRRAGLARAWNNLGVASWQLGDVDGALDAWQQAVAREPDFWDALWNLGLKAAEAKRVDVALPALRRFAAEAPAARYGADRERARELAAQLTAERR